MPPVDPVIIACAECERPTVRGDDDLCAECSAAQQGYGEGVDEGHLTAHLAAIHWHLDQLLALGSTERDIQVYVADYLDAESGGRRTG